MLSPQQQRGRLRALIVKELKRFDTKTTFRQLLKSNKQYATGFLNRSISSSRFSNMVRVQSSINGDTKIIDNVNVTVQIPWGRYGVKLDEDYGSADNATGQMTPSRDALLQWIRAKNIPVKSYVKATLKDGSEKTYTYTGISGAKIMAYHIQQNIISENQLRTRYSYAEEILFEFQQAIEEAINEWVSEMVGEQITDVYVYLNEIY